MVEVLCSDVLLYPLLFLQSKSPKGAQSKTNLIRRYVIIILQEGVQCVTHQSPSRTLLKARGRLEEEASQGS